MSDIHTDVTELPHSCKSAADRMASELEREDAYADLSESCCRELTEMEDRIYEETGEQVALVAYRV